MKNITIKKIIRIIGWVPVSLILVFTLIKDFENIINLFTSEYNSGIVISKSNTYEKIKQSGKYTKSTYYSKVEVDVNGVHQSAIAYRDSSMFLPDVGDTLEVIIRRNGEVYVGHFQDDVIDLVLWGAATFGAVILFRVYSMKNRNDRIDLIMIVFSITFPLIFIFMTTVGIIEQVHQIRTTNYTKGEIVEVGEVYETYTYRRSSSGGTIRKTHYYQNNIVDIEGVTTKIIMELDSAEEPMEIGDVVDVIEKSTGVYDTGSMKEDLSDLILYLVIFAGLIYACIWILKRSKA
ncbi:MAG: hypothetical protein K6A23_05855 [Butyrivibrio sp.]|nr:hypothetical protein [Butyrivibrio sp.]